MPPAEIRMEGLAPLRRGLKAIDAELPKELRDKLLPLAQDVASGVRARIPSRSGTAAGSVRGGVSGNNVYVQGGKKQVPYYGWLDFGTRTPAKGHPRHYGPWFKSGLGPARGRFMYAEVDARRDELERRAADAMEEVATRLLPHDH
jgi:hypothetical protein